MKETTFKGGIHPSDGKDLTMNMPITEFWPKEELVFPLSQHIGAPAEPVVEKGDKVLAGQIIAKANGFISTNISCSVSGIVKSIEPRLTTSGNMCNSIIVKNDMEYKTIVSYGKIRNFHSMSQEEIRGIVKEAGIVGMGGAGFPTHVKLTPKNPDDINYVLVNGAECEPYLTADYRIMFEASEKIVEGLRVILSLFPNAKGVIGIEDNKPEVISKLSNAITGEDRISVKVLKTKYPQGAERQLIFAITGKKINSTMLPSDVGCIVHNIETVYSVYRAVCESKPLIQRVITMTGDSLRKPGNFFVRTGTSYKELVEDAAGGFLDQPEKIVAGGPMMGLALYSLNIPITKLSSALICMTKDEAANFEPTNCIRCGRCVEACPSRLVPQKMIEYADHFDIEGFQNLNGMECYECGSCTYVCPAKRRLTQSFKQIRRSIMEQKKK